MVHLFLTLEGVYTPILDTELQASASVTLGFPSNTLFSLSFFVHVSSLPIFPTSDITFITS